MYRYSARSKGSSNFKFAGLKPGKATITYTLRGKTAKCVVTVIPGYDD